ncbi:MAG: anti-sigma factor family protein [Thermodesulfobacteriota bacterium]
MKAISCQKCQKLLSLYIDSALDPKSNSRVEAHIKECSKCAEEWRLMNRTVQLLHNMPKTKAPASLVHDIHLKLEKRSYLDLIRNRVNVLPLKRTFYGAVSLIFIGVATAVLIQNIKYPHSDSIQLAGNQEEKENIVSLRDKKTGSTVLAKNGDISSKEHYPDIPPLSEYKPGMRLPYAYDYSRLSLSGSKTRSNGVDLVSSGNYYQQNRYHSLFLTNFPDLKNEQTGPDLRIILFPQSEKEKNRQINRLAHSSAWQTRDRRNNSLLLLVPAENLDLLASLCSQYKGYSFQSLQGKGKQGRRRHLVSVHWH